MSFAAGDRVIYAKLEARRLVDVAATVVRAQTVNGRLMYVIRVEGERNPNRMVGSASIRRPGT